MTNFSSRNILETFSILIGYVVLVGLTLVPVGIWVVVQRMSQRQLTSEVSIKKEYYLVRFKFLVHFFQKHTVYQENFMAVICGYKYLISLFIVSLNNIPKANLSFLIAVHVVYIGALFLVKPYKQRAFSIRDGICHFSFIIIHFISYPLLDSDQSNRQSIGIAIVVFCWIIILTHTFFTLYQYYLVIKKYLRRKKMIDTAVIVNENNRVTNIIYNAHKKKPKEYLPNGKRKPDFSKIRFFHESADAQDDS